MSSRVVSIQQINQRHEEKLRALDVQLSADRTRTNNKLRKDSQRLIHDLVQTRIRTPSRFQSASQPRTVIVNQAQAGLSSDHSGQESPQSHPSLQPATTSTLPKVCRSINKARQRKNGRPSVNVLNPASVDHSGCQAFAELLPSDDGGSRTSGTGQRRHLPVVEVQGSSVYCRYHGQPSPKRLVITDTKTRMLLGRTHQINATLLLISQRRTGRRGSENEGNCASNSHPASSVKWADCGTVTTSEHLSDPTKPADTVATSAARGALAAHFTSAQSRVTVASPTTATISSATFLSGSQMLGFYSTWRFASKMPTWTGSSYVHRQNIESLQHRKRTPRHRTHREVGNVVEVVHTGNKSTRRVPSSPLKTSSMLARPSPSSAGTWLKERNSRPGESVNGTVSLAFKPKKRKGSLLNVASKLFMEVGLYRRQSISNLGREHVDREVKLSIGNVTMSTSLARSSNSTSHCNIYVRSNTV